MSKLKKQIDSKIVKSVNKNVRSSTRKLNPLLKSIVGKKVDIAIRNLTFSDKRISPPGSVVILTYKLPPPGANSQIVHGHPLGQVVINNHPTPRSKATWGVQILTPRVRFSEKENPHYRTRLMGSHDLKESILFQNRMNLQSKFTVLKPRDTHTN